MLQLKLLFSSSQVNTYVTFSKFNYW